MPKKYRQILVTRLSEPPRPPAVPRAHPQTIELMAQPGRTAKVLTMKRSMEVAAPLVDLRGIEVSLT